MPPLVIAALALAAAKVVKGVIDKNKASKIDNQFTPYQVSPYAQEELATARQAYNGRMAGAATEERNIDTGQASYNDFVDRNATSGAQALALAATGQARSDKAYSDLAVKEQQNKYGLLSNLNSAYQNMTNENDKVYQSKLQKYYIDTNQKRQLNAAGDQNIWGGVSDIATNAFGPNGFGSGSGSDDSGGGFNPASMVQNNTNNTMSNTSPASAWGSNLPLWHAPINNGG